MSIENNNNDQFQEVEEEQIPILSEEEQKVIISQELSLLPANEKAEIEKVVTSGDIILINRHKEQVKTFKKKYRASNFVFNPEEPLDTKTYEKALAAWRDVTKYRTKKVVVDFKSLKSPLNIVLKYYNDSEKPIIEDLKKIELAPGDYVDKYEAALKEAKVKEANDLKIRTNKRVEELIAAGAPFDGEYYSAGSEEFEVPIITIGMVNINSVDDLVWENLLEQVKTKVALVAEKQKAKNEEKRLADEKEKQDIQKLKDQNLKNRGKSLKFMEFVLDETSGIYSAHGITISKKQVEEMEIDAWDAWENETESAIELAKKKAKLRILMENRGAQLLNLGMTFNKPTESFVYDDITIGMVSKIAAYDDNQWQSLIDEITPQIEEKKQEKETARIAEEKENELKGLREKELAAYWLFVTGEEKTNLGKLTEEVYNALFERVKLATAEKVKNDAAAQKALDDKAEEERLSKEGDEAVYTDLIKRLKAVTIPTNLKTDTFKSKVATITNFINGLK